MAKFKLTEGILQSFVSKVMGNIVDNQRQKNAKALKKAHDKKLEKLEKEAAKAIQNFTSYVRDKGLADEDDVNNLLNLKK